MCGNGLLPHTLINEHDTLATGLYLERKPLFEGPLFFWLRLTTIMIDYEHSCDHLFLNLSTLQHNYLHTYYSPGFCRRDFFSLIFGRAKPQPITQSKTQTIFHHVINKRTFNVMAWHPAWGACHVIGVTHSDKTPVTRGLCSWLPTFLLCLHFLSSSFLLWTELNDDLM